MKTYVIALAIIENKGKYLLNKNENGFSFPYCTLNDNEPAEETVVREMKNQTGMDTDLTDSGKPIEIISEDERYVTLPFSLSVVGSEEKSEGHQWMTKAEISDIEELRQEVFLLQKQRLL